MIQELQRRLDAISGYIDGVHQRTIQNTPSHCPPYPNRYLRRELVEKKIEQSEYSFDLKEIQNTVPKNFCGPEFIKQLIDAENLDDESSNNSNKINIYLDRKEFTSISALRNDENAKQIV